MGTKKVGRERAEKIVDAILRDMTDGKVRVL